MATMPAGVAITIQVNPTDTPNTVQVASLHVKNSTFTGNTATGYGGAISTRRETGYGNARIYLNIDGSNFDSNRVTSAGNGGWRGGGAVWVSGCALGRLYCQYVYRQLQRPFRRCHCF